MLLMVPIVRWYPHIWTVAGRVGQRAATGALAGFWQVKLRAEPAHGCGALVAARSAPARNVDGDPRA